MSADTLQLDPETTVDPEWTTDEPGPEPEDGSDLWLWLGPVLAVILLLAVGAAVAYFFFVAKHKRRLEGRYNPAAEESRPEQAINIKPYVIPLPNTERLI